MSMKSAHGWGSAAPRSTGNSRRSCAHTPIHYIIAQRLRIARELLTSSSKPVAEIARLAGFNSEKYFLKLFKQRLGVTPSACRQAAQPAAESAPLPP